MNRSTEAEPSLARSYAGVAAVLVPVLVLLGWLLLRPTVEAPPRALLAPVLTLVGLTFAVLIFTAVVRNVAVAMGRASIRYYETYREGAPGGWIERPAKTYDNLLQLPMLFYLVCVLGIVTGWSDGTQVALAWLFVATRVVHAFVYIRFNVVPYRFAAFASGVLTLIVMWGRFALAV